MKELLKKIVVFIITWEAKLVLRKYKPKIIAVTGSVGKTTTKDAIYTVMSSFQYVRKSRKSYNSEIGIPLTILGMDNAWGSAWGWLKIIIEGKFLILFPHHYPKWLVIEMGVDRPGDIKKTVKWLSPDIAVFTRFGKVPVHVEFFDSPEDLINEKSHLAMGLKPDGHLILNYDDENVLSLKDKANRRYITYGFNEEADVYASNIGIIQKGGRLEGVNFKVNFSGKSIPISLKGVLGKQHIYPVLASVAVGVGLELNMIKEIESFGSYETPPGRMKILDGIKNSTIIDDSYNSSPTALKEALNVLREIEWIQGRKVLVLGDMMELGKFSSAEHRKAGEEASFADFLITIGPRAKEIAETFEGETLSKEGKAKSFEKSEEAAEFMKDFVGEGDLILVKGSQSPRTEKVVKAILKEDLDASTLLVRQEKEWEKR